MNDYLFRKTQMFVSKTGKTHEAVHVKDTFYSAACGTVTAELKDIFVDTENHINCRRCRKIIAEMDAQEQPHDET